MWPGVLVGGWGGVRRVGGVGRAQPTLTTLLKGTVA